MAIFKIISPNYPLEAGAAIEDTTFDVAAYPATNILHPNLWAIARSAAGGVDQYVTFDLGAAYAVRGVAILAHTIPTGPATLRFAGHGSDAWGDPDSGWLTLTWDADRVIGFFGADQTYRYWRLEVSASATFDIGGLVFGPVWQSPHQGYQGLQRRTLLAEDGTTEYESYGVGLDNLTQAESDALIVVLRRHRQRRERGPYHYGSTPTLWMFDAGDDIVDDGLESRSIYGVYAGDPAAQMGYHCHDSQGVTVEECL